MYSGHHNLILCTYTYMYKCIVYTFYVNLKKLIAYRFNYNKMGSINIIQGSC